MELEPDPLFAQLHKIPAAAAAATSEESLAQVLETLWSTRKTGLGPAQKPRIQTLLGLSSPQDVDSVLACLRLIIRKCVHESLSTDVIQKQFPPSLSIKFQSILLMLLRKYRGIWKEEASKDQPFWKGRRVSNQVKAILPPALTSSVASELPSSLWPRQADATYYPKSSNLGAPTPNFTDLDLPGVVPAHLNQDSGSLNSRLSLPRLKSMTWTIENRNLAPSDQLAIITLKLQDYTKSPSGEREVKFKVSKDTLEAMLRTMTYISEQL